MKNKALIKLALVFLVLIFCSPISVVRAYNNESIQSAPTSLLTTITAHIIINKIGENDNLNLKSGHSNQILGLTTAYMPVSIIGSTQTKAKLVLSIWPTAKPDIIRQIRTTSYQDGTFSFSVDKLKKNTSYTFKLISQTGIKPEAEINFQLIYQPGRLKTPAAAAPTTYIQTTHPINISFYLTLLLALASAGFILFIWLRKKSGVKLLIIDGQSHQLKPYYSLVITKNQEPTKIIKSDGGGQLWLNLGCYQIVDLKKKDLSALPKLKDLLIDHYLLYQTGTICIKLYQIWLDNQSFKRSKIKAVIMMV